MRPGPALLVTFETRVRAGGQLLRGRVARPLLQGAQALAGVVGAGVGGDYAAEEVSGPG